MCGVRCKVNLIYFNPHAGTHFQTSHDNDVLEFRCAPGWGLLSMQAAYLCMYGRLRDMSARCGK